MNLCTRAVFHAPSGRLNADADRSVLHRRVTLAVFHAPDGWLNADADRIVLDRVVADPIATGAHEK
jgi:hypothetical protein